MPYSVAGWGALLLFVWPRGGRVPGLAGRPDGGFYLLPGCEDTVEGDCLRFDFTLAEPCLYCIEEV